MNEITVIEYEWDDNTIERVVEPAKNEILGIADWMMGDRESIDLLKDAGLKNITITVKPFELADVDYMHGMIVNEKL